MYKGTAQSFLHVSVPYGMIIRLPSSSVAKIRVKRNSLTAFACGPGTAANSICGCTQELDHAALKAQAGMALALHAELAYDQYVHATNDLRSLDGLHD